MIKRRYASNTLIRKMSNKTTRIFKRCVIEVMDAKHLSSDGLRELMHDLRQIDVMMRIEPDRAHEYETILLKKEKIDQLYLSKLVTLSDQDLHDILFLHEHKMPRRADLTIQSIIDELTRRSLLNDSSQSDTKSSRGDSNVRTKNKRVSKKANAKKRKTN